MPPGDAGRVVRGDGPVIAWRAYLASGAPGACGTVVAVLLDDLPDWVPAWCRDHLGGEPADVLFRVRQVSMVLGLRLADGREVVVKARAGGGRAASCIAAQ